jgi:glycerol kinase
MLFLERPTMPETTALGAAMAAGAAKGIEVWTLSTGDKSQINTDVFHPVMDSKGIDILSRLSVTVEAVV